MAITTKRGIFHVENVSIFLAELFGTAILVYFSCSSCIKWNADGQLNSLQIVLTCGFAVLLSVQTFGCVSGAHINPCVKNNTKYNSSLNLATKFDPLSCIIKSTDNHAI